jgi:hypothetical protein
MDHVSNGPAEGAAHVFTVQCSAYKYEAATADQPASSITHSATDQSTSLLSSRAVVIIAMAKEEELKVYACLQYIIQNLGCSVIHGDTGWL